MWSESTCILNSNIKYIFICKIRKIEYEYMSVFE